ncbi:VCBS repeat-containing protein, partial [Paenibacillus sepulcri]|nr:VCBS repeat-containing protein [Paenibacillus sepulcri]
LPVRAKLALPVQEASNAAVNKTDIDGDGEQEAIVTFVTENDTEQVMVLKQQNDRWKKWFTFDESSSYGIDLLQVADLDQDGLPEVLIGWNQYGEPQHSLAVYHINESYNGDSLPGPIAELPYDSLGIGDADGDGRSELVLIQLDREQMKASAHLHRIHEGKVEEIASAPLNGNVNGYYNIVVGKIASDRYGILADASLGAHSSSTVMLAWNEGKLSKIYPRPTSNGEVVENNSRQTVGGDGNGDGILDINVTLEAPGQAPNLPYSDLLWLEQYKQWDGGEQFQVVQERYVDETDGYELRFPAEWREKYTVHLTNGSDVRELAVDYYNQQTEDRAELFAIEPVPLADWSDKEQELKDDSRRVTVLTEAGGFVYAVVWSEAPEDWTADSKQDYDQLQLDEVTLKQIFKLIPQH